jgi:hypothetical protein
MKSCGKVVIKVLPGGWLDICRYSLNITYAEDL